MSCWEHCLAQLEGMAIGLNVGKTPGDKSLLQELCIDLELRPLGEILNQNIDLFKN